MRDPYSVLGVSRSASEGELKSAYRRLAKAHHPDQNRGDPKAHAKFTEISTAYDFLSDKAKKGAYDRGEIDADGTAKFAGFGAGRGGAGAGGFSAEDILKEFVSGFGGGHARAGRGAGWDPAAGGKPHGGKSEDLALTLVVTLEDAHRGKAVPLHLPGNRTVNVTLPDLVEEGRQMRLKGQGVPPPLGGTAGDVIVTIRFERHRQFRRDGADLHVDVPLALYEAVLGGKVRVPTLDGSAELSLPPNADVGKALRLKGKGLHGAGDLYAHLRIALPVHGDPDLESLMRFWRDQKPYTPREP